MVKEIRKRMERRQLPARALSTVLAGLLTLSVGSMPTTAFAAENEGSPSDAPVVAELIGGSGEASETISVVFATGDASVQCNGRIVTGQEAVNVPDGEELTFTVTPHEGFAVEEVSFQMLSEGVLDVLSSTESDEGARYTVSADKTTEGMAIVVNTAAETAEEGSDAPGDEPATDPVSDRITPPFTGRTPSVNVKDVEKVYDGQPVSVKASATKSGSTLLYYTDGMSGWSAENPCFTDAGTYSVLVKTVDPNDPETDVVTAHVTVKPAPVVIKVHDAEKTAGSSDPAFEGDIEGLMPGDEIGSVVYYRLNNGVEETGFYADVLSALVQHRNGNYAYTVTPGSLTIEGPAAPAQDRMSDPASGGSSSSGAAVPVNPGLVAEFTQGEAAQRFTEGIVEPIATLLGVRVGDRTATITDDETPLSAFEDEAQGDGWAYLWIILAVIIAAAGAAFVVLRRLRPAWFMADDLDEAYERDPNLEETGALPALDALRR